jgi:hypothetical protein
VIAVRLQGGLGNQLFQYAAARAMADRLGRDLGVDLRDFARYERRRRLSALPLVGRGLRLRFDTPRPYLLDRYPIRARALPAPVLLGAGFPLSRRWRRVWRGAGLGRGLLAQEQGPGFLPGLEAEVKRAGFAYLDGYWQSWRYFQDQREALLGDLRPLRAPSGANAALLKRMARENAVCVHVRRGDYVSLPAAAAFHGLLGADYYRAAVKRLGPAARGARFYVFSDEPAWARGNLDLPRAVSVVDQNGVDEPEEDLRLMAACRHFILANSSLSWWGAWMGSRPGKRVVAPKAWFKQGPPTPDLCPKDWVRI